MAEKKNERKKERKKERKIRAKKNYSYNHFSPSEIEGEMII